MEKALANLAAGNKSQQHTNRQHLNADEPIGESDREKKNLPVTAIREWHDHRDLTSLRLRSVVIIIILLFLFSSLLSLPYFYHKFYNSYNSCRSLNPLSYSGHTHDTIQLWV